MRPHPSLEETEWFLPDDVHWRASPSAVHHCGSTECLQSILRKCGQSTALGVKADVCVFVCVCVRACVRVLSRFFSSFLFGGASHYRISLGSDPENSAADSHQFILFIVSEDSQKKITLIYQKRKQKQWNAHISNFAFVVLKTPAPPQNRRSGFEWGKVQNLQFTTCAFLLFVLTVPFLGGAGIFGLIDQKETKCANFPALDYFCCHSKQYSDTSAIEHWRSQIHWTRTDLERHKTGPEILPLKD